MQELVVVLVASGRPSVTALAAARDSDACSLATLGRRDSGGVQLAANVMGRDGSSSATGGTEGAEIVHSAPRSTKLGSLPRPRASGPSDFSNKGTSPLPLAMFGLAIVLLGMAALPQASVPDPRLNEALVRHRPEIALAGVAALAAGILALVLT